MDIAIVGTGYVGLVSGACFAELGCDVVCVDKDESKIDALSRGHTPIHEPGLASLLCGNLAAGRLRFTSDLADAVARARVVFVAVGTPPRGDGSADLTAVEDVARSLAKHLHGDTVLAMKSTVPVGTGRWIKRIVDEELAAAFPGGGAPHVDIAANPEFLREGAALEDFMRPHRVVIGADRPRAAVVLSELYARVPGGERIVTSVEAAELIKYGANTFLATKVSFVNELAALCEALGVDIDVVTRAMGLDPRIGERFLQPGPGFGGSCLPKDVGALLQVARAAGCRLRIPEAVLEVNRLQRRRMTAKIARALVGGRRASPQMLVRPRVLAGRTIALLGLAFKAGTDDVRDAPALEIGRALHTMGAHVRGYDPVAMPGAARVWPELELAADAYAAARGADAVAVLTEWPQFLALQLDRLRDEMRGRWFFDLRNVFDPARVRGQGLRYEGVGRGARPDGVPAGGPPVSLTAP